MKKIIASAILFCFVTFVNGQVSPDSVFEKYNNAKTQDEKSSFLNELWGNMAKGNFADRISSVIKLEEYFKSKNDKWGTGYLQLSIAFGYRAMGLYDRSIKYELQALKNFEAVNDTTAIISALSQIGHSFTESQNIRLGLTYFIKCRDYALATPNKQMYAEVLDDIAGSYNKLNMPDSAMPQITEALKVSLKLKDSTLSATYYLRIGETYLKKKDPATAMFYFHKSFDINNYFPNRYYADIYNDFAESFYMLAENDSSIYYANLAVHYGYPEYKKQLMTAYKWLYKNYESKFENDSVNKYYRLSMDIKDSLFTSEKNTSIVLMAFQEQMREDEIAAKKIKDAAERKENIEYSLISLAIVLTIGLFLLLNEHFIINIKVIKGFGVVTLLIVFEFFNLLLHPILERITKHSPVLMLLLLVILAAGLARLHHIAEEWANLKLIEKNKQVRLSKVKNGA